MTTNVGTQQRRPSDRDLPVLPDEGRTRRCRRSRTTHRGRHRSGHDLMGFNAETVKSLVVRDYAYCPRRTARRARARVPGSDRDAPLAAGPSLAVAVSVPLCRSRLVVIHSRANAKPCRASGLKRCWTRSRLPCRPATRRPIATDRGGSRRGATCLGCGAPASASAASAAVGRRCGTSSDQKLRHTPSCGAASGTGAGQSSDLASPIGSSRPRRLPHHSWR